MMLCCLYFKLGVKKILTTLGKIEIFTINTNIDF